MLTDIKEHTIYEKTNGETELVHTMPNGELLVDRCIGQHYAKYEYGYLNKVTNLTHRSTPNQMVLSTTP